MKKNQNIKIHNGYKAAALATLVGMTIGCKSYKHDNIVVDIQNTHRPNMVLIRDLQDSIERLIVFDDEYKLNHDVPKMLRIGDTVTIVIGGIYSDSLYVKNKVLYRSDVGFMQKQSCLERAIFEQEMSKFNVLKQQMQDSKTK